MLTETKEAGPPRPASVATETPPPPEGPKLPEKVQRKAESLVRRKMRQAELAKWLWLALEPWGVDPEEEVRKMQGCSTWIELKRMLESGRVSINEANFCDQRGLCPACDAQRALVIMRRYWPQLERARKRGLGLYLMTLTVPPSLQEVARGVASRGPALFRRELGYLRSQMETLWLSLGKLWMRKKRRDTGPFSFVEGMIASMEIEHSGKYWHAHLHCVIACLPGKRVDARMLRDAWYKLTAGHEIDLAYLREVGDCVEAFKYSVAGNELRGEEIDLEQLAWRFMAHRGIDGRRLLRTYGLFYGEEEADLSEPDELGPYETWVLRWLRDRCAYQGIRMIEG